ncbi:helix-turn-helix domain-containing protein [Nocardia terpenica]|nr:helix-turn-helix transcriptional regulator [Nocardia terpenica]NQE86196.1 helix-turn-helix transcriptional regulator [Nocardia terpenica]
MDNRAELREFLRSRRGRLKPADVGLPSSGGLRRVPGLRREELAMLAGVSVDYYVQFEQGRVRQVSDAVLNAIAGALQLTKSERTHLWNLAKPAPAQQEPGGPQHVRAGLRQVLAILDHIPAYVLGRRLDVLAWSAGAARLIADFPALPPEQRNLARLVFLSDTGRRVWVDWGDKACDTVDQLRLDAGRHPYDPQLTDLVRELSEHSTDFRRMWADQNVREKTHGHKRIRHPTAGVIGMDYETFRLPDDPDQALVVYTTAPGSPDDTILRSLSAR